MFCKLCYTSFYCALLFCVSQIVISYNMKVCGKPVSSKSVSTIFPIAFAQFISLCQILVVLAIFQTSLLYLLWRPMNSDFWCYCCNVEGQHHTLCPYKMTVSECWVCSACATNTPVPYLSLFLGLLSSWNTTVLKLGQLITLQWPPSVQVKGRVTYLSL